MMKIIILVIVLGICHPVWGQALEQNSDTDALNAGASMNPAQASAPAVKAKNDRWTQINEVEAEIKDLFTQYQADKKVLEDEYIQRFEQLKSEKDRKKAMQENRKLNKEHKAKKDYLLKKYRYENHLLQKRESQLKGFPKNPSLENRVRRKYNRNSAYSPIGVKKRESNVKAPYVKKGGKKSTTVNRRRAGRKLKGSLKRSPGN